MSPTRIGSRDVKNRIVSPPHGTYFGVEGMVSEKQLAYYAEKAAGGVGMIVVGSVAAWERSRASGGQNYAFSREATPGHAALAKVVQAHGTLLLAQLWDGGRQGSSQMNRLPLLSASPLPDPRVRQIPKEMEPDEIDEMVTSFARSAALMEEAGWDGVELLAAQGYGLAQFVSPQMNHRRDEWGGSHLGRTRIVCEIVRRIRELVSESFLVGVRINGDDMVAGGTTPEDAVVNARLLEATGCVDYLNVSGASNENFPLWIADMSHEPGLFVDAARLVKRAVSIPVMVATRVKDPLLAESLLETGAVDLVGMNRALIADPRMPEKLRAGRLSMVRPCLSCNQGCIASTASGLPLECTVNPTVGRETSVVRTSVGGIRVGIVGGGPAGLQAAVAAAERGARVTLFESREVLGGQLELASRCTSRVELGLLIEHLRRRLVDLGVDVRLGVTASPDDLVDQDEVVLATGSRPLRTGFSTAEPDVLALPGHDLPHVVTAWEVFEALESIGRRVLVAEDEPQGQATTAAEHLADHGRQVTIVTRSTSVGLWSAVNQDFLYKRLRKAGVELRPHTWITEIGPRAVVGHDAFSGALVSLGEFDTVVLATGAEVDDTLYQQLRDDPRVSRIGDCLAPRMLDDAVWDGYWFGQRLVAPDPTSEAGALR
jgi:2,4-dienoyl-CoA reductase-like NADH-dependent reductase (Old Yellow Enzyme family)/thioredoxin reductase